MRGFYVANIDNSLIQNKKTLKQNLSKYLKF